MALNHKELIVLFPDDTTDRDKDEGDLVAPGRDPTQAKKCTTSPSFNCPGVLCVYETCCDDSKPPKCEKVRRSLHTNIGSDL